jgi:hypothetical protein
MLCLGKSGAMEYERDALQSGGKRFGPGAVALSELHLHSVKPAQMPKIPHQAGYGITVAEKPFDKMASYKTGSARDQYPSYTLLRHYLHSLQRLCLYISPKYSQMIFNVKSFPALSPAQNRISGKKGVRRGSKTTRAALHFANQSSGDCLPPIKAPLKIVQFRHMLRASRLFTHCRFPH